MSQHCQQLHEYIKTLPRYHFPFNPDDICQNGIYILFEKNEHGHGGDRIVRVGTHTGQNQLAQRLMEHFVKENKNRSIFRKNIGRVFLNQTNDDYLKIWNLDLTSKKNRNAFQHLVNEVFQKQLEQQISECLRANFSFSIIEVQDEKRRLELEKQLIQIVSSCEECGPSQTWLGNHSPVKKIRQSGLWQTQHVKTKKT